MLHSKMSSRIKSCKKLLILVSGYVTLTSHSKRTNRKKTKQFSFIGLSIHFGSRDPDTRE